MPNRYRLLDRRPHPDPRPRRSMGRGHRAVVMIDVAPGYAQGTAKALRRVDGVASVAHVQVNGSDLAVMLDVGDEGEVRRLMDNALRLTTGVHGVERVHRPRRPVLRALIAAARWTPT